MKDRTAELRSVRCGFLLFISRCSIQPSSPLHHHHYRHLHPSIHPSPPPPAHPRAVRWFRCWKRWMEQQGRSRDPGCGCGALRCGAVRSGAGRLEVTDAGRTAPPPAASSLYSSAFRSAVRRVSTQRPCCRPPLPLLPSSPPPQPHLPITHTHIHTHALSACTSACMMGSGFGG